MQLTVVFPGTPWACFCQKLTFPGRARVLVYVGGLVLHRGTGPGGVGWYPGVMGVPGVVRTLVVTRGTGPGVQKPLFWPSLAVKPLFWPSLAVKPCFWLNLAVFGCKTTVWPTVQPLGPLYGPLYSH